MERMSRRNFIKGGLATSAVLALRECGRVFRDVQAVTTPLGVYYRNDEARRKQWILEHEACHLSELRDRQEEEGQIEGAIDYYMDYIQNPCAEELRCDANPDTHPACQEPYGSWGNE